jgi:FkbM family methyltransferase
MYSIWAAATRQAVVFAFEPESQNYALLNRNILGNQLQHRIKAYCLGLLDHEGLAELNMADLRAGGSNHSVGEALDFKHEPMRVAFQQGCVVSRLDALVASQVIPVPHHIKIDVDGFESKVIAGAQTVLKNPAVKSLLIETNPNLEDHRQMLQQLGELGFRYDAHQVQRAARKDGPFKGVAEYVLKR